MRNQGHTSDIAAACLEHASSGACFLSTFLDKGAYTFVFNRIDLIPIYVVAGLAKTNAAMTARSSDVAYSGRSMRVTLTVKYSSCHAVTLTDAVSEHKSRRALEGYFLPVRICSSSWRKRDISLLYG